MPWFFKSFYIIKLTCDSFISKGGSIFEISLRPRSNMSKQEDPGAICPSRKNNPLLEYTVRAKLLTVMLPTFKYFWDTFFQDKYYFKVD